MEKAPSFLNLQTPVFIEVWNQEAMKNIYMGSIVMQQRNRIRPDKEQDE